MEIEIFTACDNAQVYQDKLVIVGTFHAITSKTIPFQFESMSVACAIKFTPEELTHENIVEIQFNNADGSKFVNPGITGTLAARQPNEITQASQILNLAINVRNVEYKTVGTYYIDLFVNAKLERRFPIEIIKQ